MNHVPNWKTPVTAGDYFGQQKKRAELEDRRFQIHKPADLVGPGIAESAIRITDFNDLLATYNGFFSSTSFALNAPEGSSLPGEVDIEAPLVGWVSMDAEFGGVQTFIRLADGVQYRRTFLRAPYDAETINWTPWFT